MMTKLDRMLAAVTLAVGMSAAQASPYAITLMDLAGSTNSTGWDINNLGVFVGSATVGVDNVGYLVSGGITTTLGGPAGAAGTSAIGISDTGTVVGSYYTISGGGPQSGFIYAGGSYTTLNLPGATDTQLRGISPDGQYVTGFATMGDGSVTSFVYDRITSTFTTIVNSPALTIAQGVTNTGLVVGNYRVIPAGGPFPAGRFAFEYDIGTSTQTDFSIPGGDIRYRGITESDLIDGFFIDGTGTQHGFVGSAASYDVFDVAGGTLTALEGINNTGWLAGQYTDANGATHAFLAQPVSEPATLALIVMALGGLSVARRRSN
jgi:hypothetical protein